MREPMSVVQKVSIRRDPRFTLEENWHNVVVPAIQECQERGVLVTPLTVFEHDGIVGWYLHGWRAPPAKILYQCDPPDEYIPDYSI